MYKYTGPPKKTRTGHYYHEVGAKGVDSVILRSKSGRFELAVPDHKRVGAYFQRLKGLTREDLRAIVRVITELLDFMKEPTKKEKP